jgi:hypothetical protein
LLCRVEQARRPALADHVHRIARMGAPVLINGIWYKADFVFGGLLLISSLFLIGLSIYVHTQVVSPV